MAPPHFEFEKKLYLFDTDATQIAYYARHLEWMEAARIEFIAHVYKPLDRLMAEDGVSFVPIHLAMDYKAPARFGDVVKVRVSVRSVDKLRLVLGYAIVKAAERGETLVSQSEITLVCVDVTKGSRPTRIPATLAEALARWTASAG